VRAAPTDTARAEALITLARAIWSSDVHQAKVYADSALAISLRTGFKTGTAGAYNTIGVTYYYQGWYDLALEYYFKSLAIRQELGRKLDIANSLNNIGLIYNVQQRDTQALDYLWRALAIYRELRLRSSIALAFNNIGTIYRRRGMMVSTAAANANAAAGTIQTTNASANASAIAARNKWLDSALVMHQYALDTLKTGSNNLGFALTHQQLGVVYTQKHLFGEAQHHLALALDGYRKGGDRKGTSNSLFAIAQCYFEAGVLGAALDYARESLREAETISMRLEQRDGNELLGKIYAAQGNYKAALTAFQQFERIKDSIFNEGSQRKSAELAAQYESQVQSRQILLLERDKERSTLIRNGLFLAVVFVAMLALALYNRYRLKNLSESRLQSQNALLEAEREKSEALLLNILPKPIAERLKAGEQTIADRVESATVMFADIANFTAVSTRLSPEKLVELLDAIFSDFDAIATKHGLEKIKTIGDCYMLVGGLLDGSSGVGTPALQAGSQAPPHAGSHTERVARAALELVHAMHNLGHSLGWIIELRIGIHTGPVVAGVIGKKKFSYDLWGDTVNVASRMESHGVAGQIHCTEAVRDVLERLIVSPNGSPNGSAVPLFTFEERGLVEVKGKGKMPTFFLHASSDALSGRASAGNMFTTH
jgi:adenylate cyclase